MSTPDTPAVAALPRHLSHSQMETWGNCPRRWWLERVACVPRAPAPALIAGSAFHAAVECDGRAAVDGLTRLSRDQLAEVAECALARLCAEQDPTTVLRPTDRDEMRQRVLAMLDAYLRVVQPVYPPRAVERALRSPLPEPPGWELWGTLDALVDGRDRGKGVSILDWKSASKPWWLGEEHRRSQANAYLLLAQDAAVAEGWEAAPKQVVFVVFTTTRDADGRWVATAGFRPTTRSDEQLGAYMAEVVSVTEQMMAAHASGDFPARPGVLCGWCAVLGACLPGREWLAANGRTPAVPVLAPSSVAPAPVSP